MTALSQQFKFTLALLTWDKNYFRESVAVLNQGSKFSQKQNIKKME